MVYRLADVCDVRDGTHDSPKYVPMGYPLVTSKNIIDGRLDLSTVNYLNKEDYDNINKRSKVDSGDIIMPMIGTIGNPFLVGNFCDFAIKNVALIKFPDKNVNNKFVWYYLKSNAFKLYVNKINRGGTQKFLSLKDIRNILLPKKDLDKQKQIVFVLDKLSHIINQRQKQLELLDTLIKARFVEMFGDYNLHPQKNDWIPIKSIGTVVTGATPKTTVAEYWNGDIKWITPAELMDMSGYLFNSFKKITETGAKSCATQMMPKGTVILSSRAPIGKVAILGVPMCCNQGFKNIICNDEISPEYLYYLLSFNSEFLNSLGRGATFKEISKKIVEEIKIPLPPIGQQNKYIDFAKNIEKTKATIQKALDKAQLLFDSLMQEYFG